MSKKIVFMGTPEFSVQTLKKIVESKYSIECVYTQKPKKSFRGQKINSSPIQVEAEKLNLNIRTPDDLDSEKEYENFKSLDSNIIIVIAYGKIIPKKYLDLPNKFFINIHASLLPRWRGAAPIQRAIMNKDKVSGISFMKIEEGLDVGPYIKQIEIKLDDQMTSGKLSKRLSNLGAENILNCIDLIEKNEAQFINQDENKATYAKKIMKSEAKILWKESAKDILSKINSLNPAPGAWFEYENLRYKVWKAKISNLTGAPGEILDNKLTIGCNEKSIEILEIQKEGKKKLLINDFLIGSKFLKGKIVI